MSTNRPRPEPKPVTFTLSARESRRARRFVARHGHEDVNVGAIGGSISYRITVTSMGDIVSVRCGVCKRRLSVTDFDSW